MSWLGGLSVRFLLRNLIIPHRREGLHLCEHDSTVYILDLYIGVCDVVADLCAEFVHILVKGRRRAESVSFDNESFGDSCEVGYHVRDVTLGGVLFCGGAYDFLGSTRAVGGW